MISVRVDRCPTCQGVVESYDDHVGPCPACTVVPGWHIPEWVKVPMLTTRPTHNNPGGVTFAVPDPAYQPGVSVTFTADCQNPMVTTAEAWHDGLCCDGTGQVVVAEYVITELVPVLDKDIKGEAPDIYVYVLASDRRKWLFDHGNETPIDVDCVPGDRLAHLEEKP